MARKGLGKGLASLIPDYYNEDFDSNSTQSLEELLNEEENVEAPQEDEKNIFDEIRDEEDSEEIDAEEDEDEQDEIVEEKTEEAEEDGGSSQNSNSDDTPQESVPASQDIQVQEEHIAEVKKIVDKNPRITLWSSRSSAVFRYLRKTEPEFSISKEASVLIEEAVAKKYPEIWALFDDY